MGHLGNIGKNNLSPDIPPGGKSDSRFAILELSAFQKVSEHDRGIFFIWNFDANGCLARNRCFDSYIRYCQIQLNIIRQADDLADLHALLRLKFITGNARTTAHIRDLHLHPKAFQSGF